MLCRKSICWCIWYNKNASGVRCWVVKAFCWCIWYVKNASGGRCCVIKFFFGVFDITKMHSNIVQKYGTSRNLDFSAHLYRRVGICLWRRRLKNFESRSWKIPPRNCFFPVQENPHYIVLLLAGILMRTIVAMSLWAQLGQIVLRIDPCIRDD